MARPLTATVRPAPKPLRVALRWLRWSPVPDLVRDFAEHRFYEYVRARAY